ncbi:hypothetical protein MCOR28_003443 [Pyricularia oryzae]|nr:hypothetical protein MCOR26_000136 [Pyricularia oryzae]KAI6345521.1 hypothetical protein MCOR28_003443 [Pyricularia oryzae]KAI6360568.1 hypothetical protein MCOR32_008935 [Pyricularia oryzae]KAI6592113.1 hypothetical protein MCOR06_004326 [Pyricularia oryzae]KAI6599372.1 hypothetical protein MCOR12_005056 [Pyricularia oryzae]
MLMLHSRSSSYQAAYSRINSRYILLGPPSGSVKTLDLPPTADAESLEIGDTHGASRHTRPHRKPSLRLRHLRPHLPSTVGDDGSMSTSRVLLGSCSHGPMGRLPISLAASVFHQQQSYRYQQVRGAKTRTAVKPDDLPTVKCAKSRKRVKPEEPSNSKSASRRTTIKLEDLPQGLIKDAEPLPLPEDEGPTYPTVIQQARRNMNRFDNCVLLTRVGGFYELYFEHAQEIGPQLNLKVATKKTAAGNVAMAGFPFFQLDRFLKVLVQDLNRYVAIAEEFPNDAGDKVKSGGLMHDRRVARVITPGTLIDENFMDPYSNNYVMSIHMPEPPRISMREAKDVSAAAAAESLAVPQPLMENIANSPLGLAWLDLSTGHFITQSTTLGSLTSVLSRVSPKEIVLDRTITPHASEELLTLLAEERRLSTHAERPEQWTPADWAPMLESEMPPRSMEMFTTEEVQASNLLLHYVKDRLQNINIKLQPPRRHQSMEVMSIDKNSMRSLEIKSTVRDGALRGSLLHAVRRTVTRGGARLLDEWLSAPSTSLDVITARQDLVSRFRQDETLRDSVVLLLRRCADSHRLVQKFALGRGDPDDLLDLSRTIAASNGIVSRLKSAVATSTGPGNSTPESGSECLANLIGRINLSQPLKLAKMIRNAIDEEGLVQRHQLEEEAAGEMVELAERVVTATGSTDLANVLPKSAPSPTAAAKKRRAVATTSIREYYSADNDAWIMKSGASGVLSTLHAELSGLLQERTELQESLQDRLQASTLTLKWTPNLGHICHVKGKDARASLDGIRSLSSSRSTRSFHHDEWTDLGARLDKARVAIRAEEQRVFHLLRRAVVKALVPLRRNAAVLDELDVVTGMACLAHERGWIRPVVNHGTAHAIIGGRHPTVEAGLADRGRSFTGNDCFVGSAGHGRVWLVTGPNMAGKSTFLRQNALITVLAQVGCFVPADHAELGIVDALFSRVGSADDLYRDQSTFMVEMLETAQILRSATPRSFVVMDEIGRGTTPEDGTAVAFACVEHLVKINRCRALFATHFHAVTDLAVAKGIYAVEGSTDGVEMYCTDVEEDTGGGFIYMHKLRKGVNRQSHALKVARLAGLPEAAINVAKDVLQNGYQVPTN